MEANSMVLENDTATQIMHLLKIIERTNDQITGCKKSKDDLGVRQYMYLKSKFVKELIELLSKYQLTVQIKEAEIKEAA